MDGRTAVVVGGGIGGLSAALALHRRDWRVRVLERAPRLEPVGAGISLWPNALRALDAVGVGPALRGRAAVAGPSGLRRPDGRWLVRSDLGSAVRARFGDPLVVVHRADLVALLAAGLPPGTVRTGVTVTGVEAEPDGSHATVLTGDGAVEADLVVAADGIRSRVRHALFPSHPGVRYAGYTAWRMVVPVPTSGQPFAAFETWGRDGQRFAALPLGDGDGDGGGERGGSDGGGDRLYCYATANAPAGRRHDDEAAHLRARFGSWHEPIPSILAALPAAAVLHQDVEYLAGPLPALHHGRVAMLGDSAHAMTPDLGQGGCMAVEDAVVLAALLDAHPAPEALAAYTALRLPRTTAVATRSRRAGRLYQAPYAVQGLVARLMGLAPESAVARGLAPVVDWRPPSLPEE